MKRKRMARVDEVSSLPFGDFGTSAYQFISMNHVIFLFMKYFKQKKVARCLCFLVFFWIFMMSKKVFGV